MRITNSTIETLLNHRSIRSFTEEPVSDDIMNTLFDVARQAPTTVFYQQMSIIRVKDPAIREVIHQSSGQPYVGGTKGELLIFVLDIHRNVCIRNEAGLDSPSAGTPAEASFAFYDTLLAAQNIVAAAESLGLGTVYLGSIGRQRDKVNQALKLPQHTFALLGLLIGWPDQEPKRKPRLPRDIIVSTDTYTEPENYHEALREYDEEVNSYYDLRDTASPVPTFTKQIEEKFGKGGLEQEDFLQSLNKQGLFIP
ncbi:MAG: nitroreductase family protein [Actinomycetaceae bacterium]|nr:nitroreductase family protein [Actinomycetaceae bacterium]